MSEQIKDGGQAFPVSGYEGESTMSSPVPGMTLRQYAAIKLQVPESGDDWLDNMILASLRKDFAAMTLAGLSVQPDALIGDPESLAELAYQFADAMLAAREVQS